MGTERENIEKRELLCYNKQNTMESLRLSCRLPILPEADRKQIQTEIFM